MDESLRGVDPLDALTRTLEAAIAAAATQNPLLIEMSKRQLRLILSLLSISWSPTGQGPASSGPVGAVSGGDLGGPGWLDGAAAPASPQAAPLGSELAAQ